METLRGGPQVQASQPRIHTHTHTHAPLIQAPGLGSGWHAAAAIHGYAGANRVDSVQEKPGGKKEKGMCKMGRGRPHVCGERP